MNPCFRSGFCTFPSTFAPPHNFCRLRWNTWSSLSAKGRSVDEELVQVGIIGGAHGLKGEVRVQPTTDFQNERLSPPGLKWLQCPSRTSLIQPQLPSVIQMESLGGRPHIYKGHSLWILKFEGVETPEDAKKLSGYCLMVKAEDRDALPADEFYIQDLIDMEVVQLEDGEILGHVESVYPGEGAADILFVKLRDPEAKNPALIPFVEEFVPQVDEEKRQISVDLPPGLLEIANVESNLQKKNKVSRNNRKL